MTASRNIQEHFVNLVLANGETSFSEVKAFLKKQPHVIGTYKSITTSTNQTITLSPNHLIYARKIQTEKYLPVYVKTMLLYQILHPFRTEQIGRIRNFIIQFCRFADVVDVGDSVLIEQQSEMVPAKVEHINVKAEEGDYFITVRSVKVNSQ